MVDVSPCRDTPTECKRWPKLINSCIDPAICVVDICADRVRMFEWSCCIGVSFPTVCSIMHVMYPTRTDGREGVIVNLGG